MPAKKLDKSKKKPGARLRVVKSTSGIKTPDRKVRKKVSRNGATSATRKATKAPSVKTIRAGSGNARKVNGETIVRTSSRKAAKASLHKLLGGGSSNGSGSARSKSTNGKAPKISRRLAKNVSKASARKSAKDAVQQLVQGASQKAGRISAKRATKAASRKAPQPASVRKPEKTPRSRRGIRPDKNVYTDTLQWSDLITAENNVVPDDVRGPAFLGAISTLRFTLGVLAVACIFTLYVGHVYATQDLLAEVQQARKDNLSLRLQFNRTKGLYDAATGPAIIYERAHALGLEERMVTGPPIRVNPK